jgi:hypothetical protein
MIVLSSTLAKCGYRRRLMWRVVCRAEICCVNLTLSRPTSGVHISERNCSCMKARGVALVRLLNLVIHTLKLRLKTKEVLNVGGMPTTDIFQTTSVVRKLKHSSLLCHHHLKSKMNKSITVQY